MNFSFNSGLRFGNVVENFSLDTEITPSNTFKYIISSDFLNKNADVFIETTLITKNFNNIYELTNIPVSLNITKSDEQVGRYRFNYKAEDVIFKSKLNTTVSDDEDYLEKMLPEDANISVPQPDEESVRDVVPDDLKLINLETVKPKEPEFQFFTDKKYARLYIKVFSNRGSDASDGWLALNSDNKLNIIKDSADATDFYTKFKFILPTFVAHKLDDSINGQPITTQLNSDHFYYSKDALIKGVKNSNLGIIKMVIEGYDLYTSVNNSINSPVENKDKYQLLFLDVEGSYSKFCLIEGNSVGEKKIYMTDSSDDPNRDPVVCKLFKDIHSNGIYIWVVLKDSGIPNTDVLTQNKVWVAIGDDGKLQLVENMYSSINIRNYMMETEINIESFTNNASNANNANNANNAPTGALNYSGFKIISNPNAISAEATPDSCAAYCYNRNPSGNIGAYFNKYSDDFNCKCYNRVTMTETQDTGDESILFGSMIMDHRNNSNITRTSTTNSAVECSTSCLVDEKGISTSENQTFTFDGNKTENNCTCHVSTEITYNDGKGKITGPTQISIEEVSQEDYIPLKKYFETSSLFNFFQQPGMRTLLIMFKVITVSVALILYSYYSHYDMPIVQAIKFIFIAIFSELYLIYGFIKLVLTSYKKGIHEV